MRGCRLFLAYLVAIPFAVAGVLMLFFAGTILAGIGLLFLSGLIGAWGWMPFIPSGRELLDKKKDSVIAYREEQEGEYECKDIEPY